ncbi:cytochrome P450 [Sphingomonas lenta]|nr:cytochrome P450 [Sphingomonas lenta]
MPQLSRATIRETAAVLGQAVGPLFAKGMFVRRPSIVRLLHDTGAELAEVRALQALRARHGPGPVMLATPGRRLAVVLDPAHARRVLDETPEPFETDMAEKHAALAHFEPRGSLASRGEDRAERRRFNDRVLDSACPIHHLGGEMTAIVTAEAEALLARADEEGGLSWGAFKDGWHCMARGVVLGRSAADDKELSRLLIRLRGDANWAFLKPKRRSLRERFQAAVRAHLDRAEPGSLASLMPAANTPRAAPVDQVAQWLFAWDAAGIATFRALTLLASLPGYAQSARDEALHGSPELPLLRATILESVRLWPTTPAILRETDRETDWNGATMPAGTGLLIHAPYFHRDDQRLAYANRFAPELWLGGDPERVGLVPFSAGPGFCPAKQLVEFLGSHMLAHLLARIWRVPERRRLEQGRMPPTFDQFSLTLSLT